MGRGLYKGYHKAGADFLAVKLAKLFTRIETDEDAVLHNDMLTDVLEIIKGEEDTFFKGIAHTTLYEPMDRRKRWVFRIACSILNIGQKKG